MDLAIVKYGEKRMVYIAVHQYTGYIPKEPNTMPFMGG